MIQGKRIPAIMQHPEYRKDPWATIRLHASNSVAAKDVRSVDVENGNRVNEIAMDGLE